MDARLRAVCDLGVADARDGAGLHEYDGVVQDLSPAGVTAGLARLGTAAGSADPHDRAVLDAAEDGLRAWYDDVEVHRWNPLVHLGNLDLAGYDRDYAPADERRAARRRHLERWPEAVDGALAALDRVPAPVASGLLDAVRGAAEGLDPGDPVEGPALAAHARLVDLVADAAAPSDVDPALGAAALARVLGAGEAMAVDLGALVARGERERRRLFDLLDGACARLAPGRPRTEVVAGLVADHPDAAGVLDEARATTEELLAFCAERDLVGHLDGECRVAPAPPSRRWAVASLSWAAPFEADGPSWYHVTPPDPSWPPAARDDWLAVCNRAQLPSITAHEVAPGHFVHGRALRTVRSPVARAVQSASFVEGWAHYAEELVLEEGFRGDDPRFAAGVALEGLIRVTRLLVAVGVHTGAMSMEEAVARFEADAHLAGPAARSEAARATFDPTYGRYTWGKLELVALRDEARARWGGRYSHRRFHDALLGLGAPPLGLIDAVFDVRDPQRPRTPGGDRKPGGSRRRR